MADKLEIRSAVGTYKTIKDPAAAGARVKGVPEVFKGMLVFPFDDYAAGVDQLLVYGAWQIEANATAVNTVLAQVNFLNGDLLFWDTANSKITNVPGQYPVIGRCLKANDLSAAVPAGSVLLLELDNDIRLRIRAGQTTTATATDTVATGLQKVISVTASYETDPADANTFVSAQVGDQAGSPAAGSIIIKTWKSGDGADVTPVAASAFSKKVNWVAVGY